jgi:hypothetical protein
VVEAGALAVIELTPIMKVDMLKASCPLNHPGVSPVWS